MVLRGKSHSIPGQWFLILCHTSLLWGAGSLPKENCLSTPKVCVYNLTLLPKGSGPKAGPQKCWLTLIEHKNDDILAWIYY